MKATAARNWCAASLARWIVCASARAAAVAAFALVVVYCCLSKWGAMQVGACTPTHTYTHEHTWHGAALAVRYSIQFGGVFFFNAVEQFDVWCIEITFLLFLIHAADGAINIVCSRVTNSSMQSYFFLCSDHFDEYGFIVPGQMSYCWVVVFLLLEKLLFNRIGSKSIWPVMVINYLRNGLLFLGYLTA